MNIFLESMVIIRRKIYHGVGKSIVHPLVTKIKMQDN